MPTKATGPTEHLETVEYWRDNYITAIEVGQGIINRIREIHVLGRIHDGKPWCRGCNQDWPCPTIKALEGRSNVRSVISDD